MYNRLNKIRARVKLEVYIRSYNRPNDHKIYIIDAYLPVLYYMTYRFIFKFSIRLGCLGSYYENIKY